MKLIEEKASLPPEITWIQMEVIKSVGKRFLRMKNVSLIHDSITVKITSTYEKQLIDAVITLAYSKFGVSL